MLVLFETPAGYALFKVLDEGKLEKVDDIIDAFSTQKKAGKIVTLQSFKKFKDTKEALLASDKLIKGKFPKVLKKFLEKNVINDEVQEKLAIADKKLGNLITTELGIECLQNKKIDELFRGIRGQINHLVEALTADELKSMTLGLAHGLSRYKLKFSTEKVDTMIIQAVSLIEDLDKELNNFMMRLREWYGWHFPELGKIVTDNLVYAKTVKAIGMKHKAAETDLTEVVPEEIVDKVKEAAEVSMGTEITETDEKFILNLADQIIELSAYREILNDYLKNRMKAIAPNLTTMVGELVGAKLIAHAGSLINLAKYPASTIQILGAEKALFRAMRTKHNTPKYGLIYQASLVGQSHAKVKGKISRTLAAKCSVCIRVDALGESENAEIGTECRSYIEKRLAFLESHIGQDLSSQNFKKGKPKTFAKPAGGTYNPESDLAVPVPKLSSTFVASKKKTVSDSPKPELEEEEAQHTKKKKVKA